MESWTPREEPNDIEPNSHFNKPIKENNNKLQEDISKRWKIQICVDRCKDNGTTKFQNILVHIIFKRVLHKMLEVGSSVTSTETTQTVCNFSFQLLIDGIIEMDRRTKPDLWKNHPRKLLRCCYAASSNTNAAY